ncbi:cell cycle exit and neuronal differentiation protein 1 isoform X2 [Motacilla alba alba]|uniref:cell cycle exit and neuronal differentiation protein 1 isoform X2 n=1 Tax=Motacilla alba alba TaxID=1094192 RepID=UPI0018D54EDC|nr:cell cycle exit and neuronal differentiation protein 1 isoform X2 [Motacilla alba alba]
MPLAWGERGGRAGAPSSGTCGCPAQGDKERWRHGATCPRKKILPCEGAEAVAHIDQRSCGCPIPGSVQGQAVQGLEASDPVEGVPACGMIKVLYDVQVGHCQRNKHPKTTSPRP